MGACLQNMLLAPMPWGSGRVAGEILKSADQVRELRNCRDVGVDGGCGRGRPAEGLRTGNRKDLGELILKEE